MKKLLLFLLIGSLSCTCACGVRKNWKSVKNATWILQNQQIEIAKHIYGTPDEILPTTKGENKIYIWGAETSHVRGVRTSGSKTIESKTQENLKANSTFVYDYGCYIALKVNSNGTIIDSLQEGFEDNLLSQGCQKLFARSKEFCNKVSRQTLKEKHINIGDCHRQDISQNGSAEFVIPQAYQENYHYQKDDFFNN